MDVKPLPVPGDACPQCGGDFVDARQLTPEERAAVMDRENPVVPSGFVDTASAAVLAKFGPLAKCERCGYQTRYPPESIAAREAPAAGPATAAMRRRLSNAD